MAQGVVSWKSTEHIGGNQDFEVETLEEFQALVNISDARPGDM